MSSYADAAAFRNAAVSGQLGVDPDAAQNVLKKIRAGKDSVETLLRNAGALAEAPKLGANPVGNAIAAKFAERADGGGDSYTTALQNLYGQYEQAEQAIVAAMSHYQQIDQAAADALSGRA
ncbi:hypothetical protein FHX82_002168 [Amycolatopsis bartoniae]|uniref:PE domain-containing protein n=1 Tax=Amycolatopsis bartoniae TaxID=941986 RepID=A0A8H9J218_9PSEU|nr:hypothetical protein [Amycolatopsis bartoniae]MBB2935148.1 hypothetical protein [Amycolatopsis bartoniae]TVT07022.1 hypothetical protein FNH07_17960 [Amycolatopsis bartoniae]GHF74707.1 hypothetical protein GCM10017566_55650 [Amycolatopsis bartoniae]